MEAGGDQASATVSVTVTSVNDDPIADPDSATLDEDDPATAIPVLIGDSDIDGDTLDITGKTNGAMGTVVITGGGTGLTYEPDPDANGADSFTYTVSDGHGGDDTATVSITIDPVNDAPVADDDTLTVAEDASATAVAVLTGDTDVDGDTLKISAKTNGTKGTVVITGGSPGTGLTYDPTTNLNGSDTFTYTVTDSNGGTDVGTVTVTITPSQDAPTADNDSFAVPEDADATSLDVLTGDADVDGDALTILFATDPTKGTVAITGGGTGLTYDPIDDASGADTFDYTISDGHGGSDTATVSITITPSNDQPTADDDSLTVAEDAGATAVPVLTGDVDIDGDTLTITGKTNGTKGTVTITGGGTGLTYDPTTNLNGTDSFTYTISDGHGGTATATVTVTITPSNDNPTADADAITVAEDSGATAVPVLVGDGDIDGDSYTITSKTNGTKGVVAITGGGTGLTYDATTNLFGTDTFTYTISDGHGGTAVGTVTVTITPSQDAPTADNETLTIAEDAAPTSVPVLTGDLDVDGDILTITSKTNGTKGVVVITGGGTGLTYDSNLNLNGSDSFTYTISDGHGGTATGTVSVTITAVNDAPTADNETLTVAEDAAATSVPVLIGDKDVENDPLTITAKTNGTKGAVTITGGGTGLTYKPYIGFSGPDSFTYTVSDGHGGTAIGTVTVTITGVNDPPTAGNDGSMSVAEGAAATALAVLGNDTDPDGDTLKITKVTSGTLGTVAITGGGAGLTYDPASLKKGIDTFTYTVSDGRGGTDTATVRVTIVADKLAPVISTLAESFPTQTLGSQVKVRLSWKASDPGSGIKSYTLQRSLDGAAFATIGPPAATALTFDWSLTPGHAYRFRLKATDRENNVSSYVTWPTLTPTRYEESTTLATYVGTWTTSTNASMAGGKGRFASATTAKVTLTATGRDIAWVATKTTSSGRAQVFVDGVYKSTINLRASATQYKQFVYGIHFADLVSHKFEIRSMGDGRVDVDGFIVIR